MYELVGYVRHTNLPWEILTAAGVINRELVVWDKNEWIKEYISPTVVVTCTMTGSQKGMFAFEGSVLIDDRIKNIESWEANGGIGILHTSAAETIKELKTLRNGSAS
jgi:5'(3')-deoxyribonucleotidase